MIDLADVDPESPVGTIRAVVVDGVGLAVIRHAEGWVHVPSNCTHAGCAFAEDGELVDGTTLICNCHGSEFDLRTGQVLVGPAEDPLVVAALTIEAGHLRTTGGR